MSRFHISQMFFYILLLYFTLDDDADDVDDSEEDYEDLADDK